MTFQQGHGKYYYGRSVAVQPKLADYIGYKGKAYEKHIDPGAGAYSHNLFAVHEHLAYLMM